jgi:hypothetical protein
MPDSLARRARRAAPLLALAFVAATEAQLPRPEHGTTKRAPAPAPDARGAPPAVGHGWAPQAVHLDIRVIANRATIRQRVVFGPPGEAAAGQRSPPIDATDPDGDAATRAAGAPLEGCGDLRPEHAEFLEAGGLWDAPARDVAIVRGDRLVVETLDEMPLAVRGSRRRLALPLAAAFAAPAARFSAEVSIAAGGALAALGSGTHAAQVDGLGEAFGRLVVAEGEARAGRFFAFEFDEVDAPDAAVGLQTTPRMAWGGETWPRATR